MTLAPGVTTHKVVGASPGRELRRSRSLSLWLCDLQARGQLISLQGETRSLPPPLPLSPSPLQGQFKNSLGHDRVEKSQEEWC